MEWSEACAHIVGSAPASISAIANSKWPFCTASIRGLVAVPLACWTRPATARCRRTLHRRIHIRARCQKRTHGLEVAATHGKEERRKPRFKRRVDLGSGIDQRAGHRSVPLGRRPHQGRLTEPFA